MVTKLELQKKANDEIIELKKKMEAAVERHKSYYNEDEAEREYYRQFNILGDKIYILIEKRWVGNWEKRDNWYYGNIPAKLKDLSPEHSHESEILKGVLNEIADQKEKEIKKSEEYKQLNKELNALKQPIKTTVHIDIEKEIEILHSSICSNERRLCDIEDRGKFIKICINEKRYEQEKKRQRIDEALKVKFKEIILERNKDDIQ